MYEEQVVSYPRTEDKTITHEQFNDLLPLVDDIAQVVSVDSASLTHREPRETHVKEQGSHGANRPGINVPASLKELSTFGPSAARIYEILSRNYLAMLAENYEYRVTKANIKNYPNFITTINEPIELNWKKVYRDKEETEDSEKQLGKNGSPFVFEGQNSKPTLRSLHGHG